MKAISPFLLLVILLAVSLLLSKGHSGGFDQEKPVFLPADPIANQHKTSVAVWVDAVHKPSEADIENLKRDYSSIWAHLGHLYSTNDVLAGKEYYTEAFFKNLCANPTSAILTGVKREDVAHELHISNWSTDNLVCTAVDRSITFKYHFPDDTEKTTQAAVALVLLFQGDHWRLDALRIESEITNK